MTRTRRKQKGDGSEEGQHNSARARNGARNSALEHTQRQCGRTPSAFWRSMSGSGQTMHSPANGPTASKEQTGCVLGQKAGGDTEKTQAGERTKVREGRGPRTLAFPRVRWKPQVPGDPDTV